MRSKRALRSIVCLGAAALLTCGCSGGGGGSTPRNNPTPTPSPAPTGAAAAFVCPTSDAPSAVTVATSASRRRILPARHTSAAATAPTGLIAVSYSRSTAQNSHASIVSREASLGASLVAEYDFSHIGRVTRVLSVAPARAASVKTSLRSQLGVLAVGDAGVRRYVSSVTAPYFSNDPYFAGFATTSADVPGQWDMHAMQLEHAFAYSQPSNGSGVTNPSALGSSGVKIAIIDTGEDSTHPELHSKIAYQKCFVTNLSGTQSKSNFSSDPFGHGTDVSGIAAADLGNGLGFAGAGGNAVIYGYRVFPTPDDNCANDGSSDPQCRADDADIVSAINDAVTQHVNVINLSLGGDTCASGVDPDPLEGDAIANAIAANIVVVAAAGNSSSPGSIAGVQAPACDTGVIAVGATGLADGQPNGDGNSGGSATSPFEYLASYSSAGSPGASLNSAAAWGIVAPGGDPTSAEDADNFHWIENLWTSTPYQSSPSDENFVGECTDDYPNETGTTPPVDCRTEIAGTSMSSPHVAGAAALILSVKPSYQSPAAMKQLLCQTADDIGDPHEGCGRLNIYRAMAQALADPSPRELLGSDV